MQRGDRAARAFVITGARMAPAAVAERQLPCAGRVVEKGSLCCITEEAAKCAGWSMGNAWS